MPRRRPRRERCIKVILSCPGCGRRELWWVPLGVIRLGRCTCPGCGEQMHDPEADRVGADIAWEQA